MIVLGLDLSLTCTGLAAIRVDADGITVSTHRVKSSGKAGATANETADRIELMRRQIVEWAAHFGWRDSEVADLAVIESPSFGSKGGAAHERGGLYWGVLGFVSDIRIPIAEVAPKTRAIYGVGHGKGSGAEGKREVKLATQARYGELAEIPDDNVADAVLLAGMGARRLGYPIEHELPATHARALDSVKWPA